MDENRMNHSASIRHPGAMFLGVTIPQGILLALYFQVFQTIRPLLSDETVKLWACFGFGFISLTAAYTIYGIRLLVKGNSASWLISPAIFLTFLPFLYLFGMYFSDLFPPGMPPWMASGEIIMYPGAFLMPAFIYALITAVRWLTPENGKYGAGRNFVFAILVPSSWYVFFRVVGPTITGSPGPLVGHFLLTALITSTVVFLFFAMRGVYILLNRKSGWLQKNRRITQLVFTFVFPLLGLAIYGGLFESWENLPRVFGDFSHPVFPVLAAFNGVVLSLPNPGAAAARAGLYLARVFTLPFTLYFFLVFLPFFPLSVIASVAAGVGVLMLTPLVLMGIHAETLGRDFRALARRFPKAGVIAVSMIAFSVLPVGVTLAFYRDRVILHRALDYVYEPDYRKNMQTDFDPARLRAVLDEIEGFKKQRRFREKRIPFITPYYRWLVFDNLTLSNRKIDFMRKIFYNESREQQPRRDSGNRDSMVEITDISTAVNYDEQGAFYRSRIDLTLTNHGGDFQEYITRVEMPEGAWISDYYLWIGGEKVHGELAERKSALWTYRQIRRTRKDPGLVYYRGGNRIVLRVFPFDKGQVRKTGLEIMHKGPVSLDVDGHVVALGSDRPARDFEAPLLSKNHGAVYLPVGLKSRLPGIRRAPYFHFILDCSLGAREAMEGYAPIIQDFLSRSPFYIENIKITLMNFAGKTLGWNDAWQDAIKKFPARGGFYLDHALKTILIQNFRKTGNEHPVIIVITPDFDNAVFSGDLSDLSFTFPESDLFYSLGPGGAPIPRSLTGATPARPVFPDGGGGPRFPVHDVLAWPGPGTPLVFVRDNGKASVALLPDKYKGAFHTVAGDDGWSAGLYQRGEWMEHLVHPDKTGEIRPRLVRLGRENGVLNPFTAYTVLENRAQWNVLRKKEKAALSGKHAFDLSEDAHEMSEPSLLSMVVGVAVLVCLSRRRRPAPFRATPCP